MKPFIKSTMLLAVSATLAMSLALSGCDRFRNFTDQEHVQRAKDFQAKGDLRASEIELKNALGKNANNVEARLLLGEVYLASEQGASAEKELKRAQTLGVGAESLKVPLARAYLLQNKNKELLDEIQPGPQTSARNQAQILQLRGDALLGLQQGKQACGLYAQANQADAQFIDAYRSLAMCAKALDKDEKRAQALMEQALQLANQAVAKSPQDFESLLTKADLLRAMGKTADAHDAYTAALKVHENDVGAHLSLASIAIEQSKLDEARKYIEQARKLQPDNAMAIYMEALVDFGQQKYTQASDHIQQVLKSSPGHLPSLALFGAVSFSLGAYEQAEQSLSRVLERTPGNTFVRKMLAATRLKQNQPSLALEALAPMLPQTTDPQVLGMAGEIYMALRDAKKAAVYFEQAAHAAPTDVTAQTRLGVSRLAAGDLGEGIADLEKASGMDPKQFQSDGVLVRTYMQLGQYDKALAAVDALEKKQPKSPAAHNLRGGVYLGKNDLANARKSFEQALAIDPTFMPAATNLALLDMEDKKPDDARKRFQNVLAKDANSVPAMLALADLAAKESKDKEYLEWITKAAKADSKAIEPKARLVAYYLNKKENQRALELAHEAQAANADSPQAWELLGQTQTAMGEKDNAIASSIRVTQLAPRLPRGYLNLGMALVRGGRVSDARNAFNKALELNPDYAEARNALATLELQQNRGAEALKLAQEQTRSQPKSPAGPILEGDVLMTQKNYAQAAEAYTRAFNLAKTGAVAVKLHQAMAFGGKIREADTLLNAWLKDQPNDIGVRWYLADSLVARGDYPAAIMHYELALKTSPDNALILNNLAEAYSAVKDPRALATAERALKLAPDHPGVQDTAGWILLKGGGDQNRALELLKTAASKLPDTGAVRYHYAVALARSGKKAEAKKELEATLRTGKKFPEMEEAKAMLRTL